ncbi:hypothetical protein HGRIS_006939 [Hohenbuehelia grisea]|uniref:O-methyltransferase domain-containing protein n=1 Tax=Hohenbuehelia grisea TaxID=104357 RepID=A0ABR3JB93_9AGAR
MPSVLRHLLQLLTEAVDRLEQSCASKGTPIPDLDEPLDASSAAFHADSEIAEDARIIGAAAVHLAAIVTPPPLTMYSIIGGLLGSAALRVCLESHVTEILREAGPQGLTPEQISAINGQDPKKLGRFLRVLATHHIYREVEPNVFANNRVSSALDTGKSSGELSKDPATKYDNTNGFGAVVGHHLDEVFKAAAYSWEAATSASETDFEDPTKTPFNKAYNTNDKFFSFVHRPEEAARRHRLGLAMKGGQTMQHPDAVLSNHASIRLVESSYGCIVDVGGGIGTSALKIASHFPNLKLVVQDLPEVLEDAKAFWSQNMPEAITSSRVTLEAHDFFAPQTRKPAVFFLKQVLHDWPGNYCVQILQHLRDAAGPNTRLVVVDSIIRFACKDSGSITGERIQGYEPKEAPAPLLANYGAQGAMAYIGDMVMYLTLNAQERTITQHAQLLCGAGWQIVAVRQPKGDGSFGQGIEAVPV